MLALKEDIVVTLLDVKMRIPAGRPVVWNGWPYTDEDRMAVVMMPGPVTSSVWALECENWLCLKWNGHRQAWLNITKDHPAGDQQARVVVLAAEAEYRRGRYGRYAFPADREWSREAAEHYRLTVMGEIRSRLWGELYPDQYVTRTD